MVTLPVVDTNMHQFIFELGLDYFHLVGAIVTILKSVLLFLFRLD